MQIKVSNNKIIAIVRVGSNGYFSSAINDDDLEIYIKSDEYKKIDDVIDTSTNADILYVDENELDKLPASALSIDKWKLLNCEIVYDPFGKVASAIKKINENLILEYAPRIEVKLFEYTFLLSKLIKCSDEFTEKILKNFLNILAYDLLFLIDIREIAPVHYFDIERLDLRLQNDYKKLIETQTIIDYQNYYDLISELTEIELNISRLFKGENYEFFRKYGRI